MLVIYLQTKTILDYTVFQKQDTIIDTLLFAMDEYDQISHKRIKIDEIMKKISKISMMSKIIENSIKLTKNM